MEKVIATLIFAIIIARTNGQLHAEDVSDGVCRRQSVPANFSLCLPTLFIPQTYVIRLASASLYRNYAESFLGRPANDQAELDAMCLTFGFIETVVIQQGYQMKANVRTVTPTDPTTPLGLAKVKLEDVLAQSPGSTIDNQYDTLDQVVWCTEKNFLIVRCVNGIRQDWKLVSVGDPEPWVKSVVLKKVADLNMPPENALEYKSVSNGGTCPDVAELFTYTLIGARSVNLPFLQLMELIEQVPKRAKPKSFIKIREKHCGINNNGK